MIITIARTFGSGGRQVGELLAQKLGISCYDHNLLSEAARQSGINEDFFRRMDEHANNHPITGGLFGMRFPFLSGSGTTDQSLDANTLFQIQSDTIRTIADREEAIFIGRCADYVLRERTDCLKVFIFANADDCVKRVVNRLQVDEEQAAILIEKTNKQRSKFYNYFSSKTWGKASTYDIAVNTSLLGIEATAESLAELARQLKAKATQR